MKRIVENDLGLPGAHVESYSYPQVERRFFLSLITNFLVAETLIVIFAVLAMSEGSHLAFFAITAAISILTAVIAAVYYPLGRYFLEICRTKHNFLAAPPLIDDPFDLLLLKKSKTAFPRLSPNKSKVMFGISLLQWIGVIGFCIYYFSFYSWDKYPIPKGICAVLLVAGAAMLFVLEKRMKKPHVWLTGVVSALWMVFLLFVLEYIELGNIYFVEFCLRPISVERPNPIQVMNTMMVFITIFFIPASLYHGFRVTQEKSGDKETNDETFLREAIARFDPVTMTADEPEVAAKPFPKRWIWIIGFYAVGIVVVYCLGVLFPAF